MCDPSNLSLAFAKNPAKAGFVNGAGNSPVYRNMADSLTAPAPAPSAPIRMKFRCPCCGARTLTMPTVMELCPVCWWEDDGQDGDPGSSNAAEVHSTVNGDLSLSQARRNFQNCGAAHPRFVRYVRPARLEEE
jgi:hypothetical protein